MDETESELERLRTELRAITDELGILHDQCRNWIGPIQPRLDVLGRIEKIAERVRALDRAPTNNHG